MDALAAAEFGDSIITSPNCSFLYEPLTSPRSVQLRRDYRFGADDPTLYPQWIRPTFNQHIVTLAKPEDLQDARAVMWWDGAKDNFVQAVDVTIGGVGFIGGAELKQLEKMKDDLLRTFFPSVDEACPSLDQRSRQSLQYRCAQLTKLWDRLTLFPGDLEEKCAQVTELQRGWLDLQAYYTFTSQTLGYLNQKVTPPTSTYKTLGCFTADVNKVVDCLYAGVPVFFVRPKSTFTGPIRIDNIVTLRTPTSHTVEAVDHNRHYPVVFKGDPRLAEHAEAQLRWMLHRNVAILVYDDLVNNTTGPG